MLVHYDSRKPLRLTTYASLVVVSVVFSHIKEEIEVLTIIYGINTFHKYLYGRMFTLITGHKPPVTILGVMNIGNKTDATVGTHVTSVHL